MGDVAGKDMLHLQCHFGLDTISWARLGARVTGVDYAARAIERARTLAAELGHAATFVHSDINDLPSHLEGQFDVVYTSRGVLGWLPDLGRWAQVIEHFLRPGGIFYITEMHPFVWPFDDSGDTTELRVCNPYYPRTEPMPFPVGNPYADRLAQVEQEFEYVWQHSIGEIVTALASAVCGSSSYTSGRSCPGRCRSWCSMLTAPGVCPRERPVRFRCRSRCGQPDRPSPPNPISHKQARGNHSVLSPVGAGWCEVGRADC